MIASDWFGKWKIYGPERVAVFDFDSQKSYQYGEINDLAEGLAGWFIVEKGLKKGDRIAILAENCPEYIVLFSVAQKTGLIIIPLNYRLTSREIDFLLNDSKPEMIIYDEKFSSKIASSEAFAKINYQLPIDELTTILNGIQKGVPSNGFQSVEVSEDHPLFIIYTSGTTAFPKGSVYSHKMLLWNALNTEIRLDITSIDVSINCAPPFHTGSWNVLMTPFFLHGATTILMKGFDPDKVLQVIEKENVTVFWGVPTMLKMMAESLLFLSARLNSLRYIIVGGEAMPVTLIDIWHQRNIAIRQGYGLTEVGPNVTSLNHTDAIRKQGSIGTPNFFIETRIVDECGNELLGEATGEFLLKGPTVTPGYWNNEEATRQTIRNGWFHTGDIVKRDAEGFLYVVDRLKNMYISGGENVYPAEVEFLLRKHPAIDQVAVIGVADQKWGETGMAFIVARKGESINKNDLTKYCTENLAKYKVPKHFRFVDELPRNDAGKIDRKQLKKIIPATD